MATVSKKVTIICIDCDEPIYLESKPKIGQIITCSNCDAQLEVIDIDPIELDWAYLEPEEDEDWDWEDDDDDEDERY